jgi:hypothetical protein
MKIERAEITLSSDIGRICHGSLAYPILASWNCDGIED